MLGVVVYFYKMVDFWCVFVKYFYYLFGWYWLIINCGCNGECIKIVLGRDMEINYIIFGVFVL